MSSYIWGLFSSDSSLRETTRIGLSMVAHLWRKCIAAMNSDKPSSGASVNKDLSQPSRVTNMIAQVSPKSLESETSKHSNVISLENTIFCKKNKAKKPKLTVHERINKKTEKRLAKMLPSKKGAEIPKVKHSGANSVSALLSFPHNNDDKIEYRSMMSLWLRG